ncbi:endoplasmic reticulum metallopeptidase 1 isoform X1 [Stegostoma tigrinum]|uniref:endoplasmic reticulum metallopeptidase 1 isoform X1 n=1 Tax=Stegostoma tigrinum TaxID=3053191 RepID=UPI00286FFA32|nr:endoplasmic reticulum metallopeptidase 1 isoform X1 [Stegostoma tigrinum]
MSAVTRERSGLESGSRSRAVRIRGAGANTAETQAPSPEPVSWARARRWHRPGKGREDGLRTAGEVADVGASLLVAVYLLLLWALIQLSLRQLVAVGPSEHRDSFDAKAARKHLQHITAFGPRPVGSPANEILTVNYLLKQIQEIKGKAVANNIVVDIQRPTGFFSIDFLGGFSSYYDNITNVVVKLEPKKGAKHAVLANCHFDSVANSPGASDDAVSCAVMLEVLNALSNSSTRLQHAVIFLFNGAEENVLQASHGFITQHPWVKLIRAFINLEAAGVGGKELVFQTGPENPWLVQAYVRAAKHPFASVVGQEVFQSGIIPSDTDFRIYRDYGNIPGIDLAFIENGYIYHTKYDTADRIPLDSIRRAGDNILAVLQYLATSAELADSTQYRHGAMVFFDVLGLFVVAYPQRIGAIINYLVAVAAVIYLGKKFSISQGSHYRRDLLYGIAVTITCWFIIFVTILIVAVFVSLTGHAMSWYSNFYVSAVLYGSIALAKLILIHTLAKNLYYEGMNEVYLAELYFDVSLTIWCCTLVYFTQRALCSAYVPGLWVAFPLSVRLMIGKELAQKGATVKLTAIYFLGLFIPHLLTMYLFWGAFEMFTPILGRSGTEIPPDVALASIIGTFTIILTTYFVSLVYLYRSTKWTLLGLGIAFLASATLVCSGAFFPYTSDPAGPHPKRIFLQHTTRKFHDLNGEISKRDSGIWINGFDYTLMSHVTPHIPEINNTIRSSCENAPFCGFPWFLPVHNFIRKNWYLPAAEISPKTPVDFKLISKYKMPSGSTKLNFEVTGPSHMTLYIRPLERSRLIQSSFGAGTSLYNNNGDYFVFYSHGLMAPAWQFWLEMQTLDPISDSMVVVAIASHHLFGEDQKTAELTALEQRFPEWCVVSSWSSSYNLFVF